MTLISPYIELFIRGECPEEMSGECPDIILACYTGFIYFHSLCECLATTSFAINLPESVCHRWRVYGALLATPLGRYIGCEWRQRKGNWDRSGNRNCSCVWCVCELNGDGVRESVRDDSVQFLDGLFSFMSLVEPHETHPLWKTWRRKRRIDASATWIIVIINSRKNYEDERGAVVRGNREETGEKFGCRAYRFGGCIKFPYIWGIYKSSSFTLGWVLNMLEYVL